MERERESEWKKNELNQANFKRLQWKLTLCHWQIQCASFSSRERFFPSFPVFALSEECESVQSL